MIAQQLALEYPQIISNLLIVSSSPAGGKNVPFMKPITAKWFKSTAKLGQVTDKIQLKKLAVDSMLFSLGPLYDKMNRNNMNKVNDYIEMSMGLRKPMQTTMSQLKAISKWNGIPKLKLLNEYSNMFGFDIILIHGDEDNVCDIRNSIFLNQRLTNSKVFTLKGIGHLVYFDDNSRHKLTKIIANLKQCSEKKSLNLRSNL